MDQRIAVAPSTAFQFSSLAQPRIVEVTKPQRGESIAVELRGSHSTKLNLSAVADENMTFVHTGTKLVIQFDNQSTVVADPFFDSSGKPFPYLDIELRGGRSVTGEQFAQLVSETVGQSGFPDDDMLPSGAHFDDPLVDPLFDGSIGPLPHGSSPLAQLGEGQQGPNLFAEVGGVAPSQQIFSAPTPTPAFAGSGAPVVSIPAPGGATTQVFEAGLGPRGSEPAGSQAGKVPITTQPGLINFTSPPTYAAGNTGKTPNEVQATAGKIIKYYL